jgi:hypothetical protein
MNIRPPPLKPVHDHHEAEGEDAVHGNEGHVSSLAAAVAPWRLDRARAYGQRQLPSAPVRLVWDCEQLNHCPRTVSGLLV